MFGKSTNPIDADEISRPTLEFGAGNVKRVGTAFHSRFLRLPKPLKQSIVKLSEQMTICFFG